MPQNQRIADSDRFVNRSVFKTVFLYAAFAALWILFSDQAVVLNTSDPEQIALFSTLKGLFFVTVTSLLLAFMMRRFFRRLAAVADELAKKGNAQALLMLGDFYSPKQPQRGTIQKDTDMANDCYKKALAAGAAEAQGSHARRS